MTMENLRGKSINAIRILSAEAITKAKSGHPGICMDAAPVMYTLYSEVMNYSNINQKWQNRDRFVLSAGHGSAMLYSTLHLFGFGISKEDLQSFRQYKSITPGHPEFGLTDGVDCSTGPLGQGIANAVGMALAEEYLAANFNREGFPVVDHYTYALCGEGCLEEGIGYEACSFAGTQKLGKLILFYDCNKISIEGATETAFSDDIPARFAAMHWQVEEVADVNDTNALLSAVERAKKERGKPAVIICHSKIGFGTPVAGTAAAHGTPLSADQLAETKANLNWNEQPFGVPEEVEKYLKDKAYARGAAEREWQKLFKAYAAEYPDLAEKYNAWFNGEVPDLSDLYATLHTDKDEATRISGGIVINEIAKRMPNLLSGSADLTPSTKTNLVGESWFSPENRLGRNIHFGIREHAMAAICNGVAFHGGLKIICSTFFVFSDYMKGAMRVSAIAKLPVIYVLTHDSIGVGEDGPTHEPIEQLAMLRATPNTDVWRPADRAETVAAFKAALSNDRPTVITLSRQNLKQINKKESAEGGAYIADGCGATDVTLVASGSEVDVCRRAKDILIDKGLTAKVISVPCVEAYERSGSKILSDNPNTVCVEASSDNIWYKYGGAVIKMNSFGLSAPMEKLFAHFGFTPENVAEAAVKLYNNK